MPRAITGVVAVLTVVVAAAMPASATLVRLDTVLGQVDVELYDDVTPLNAANFVNYVESEAFNNSIIHRSAQSEASGFNVLQGGRFKLDRPPTESGAQLELIPTGSPVPDEVGLSNVRGTIGMGLRWDTENNMIERNSGTSQFYFNMSDHPFLDSDYTVFGRVVAGMEVLDAMSELQRWYIVGLSDSGSPGEVPLLDSFTDHGGNIVEMEDLVVIYGATVIPEPATLVLLSAGLVLCGRRRRR